MTDIYSYRTVLLLSVVIVTLPVVKTASEMT